MLGNLVVLCGFLIEIKLHVKKIIDISRIIIMINNHKKNFKIKINQKREIK